ncbi:MAG: phosphate signaling complex protein PhoU [Candidatus Methanofastidiosia archaeon]
MTRNHFERQLEKIKKDLLFIGEKTEELILQSINALKEHDVELAQSVINDDKIIDEGYIKIEKIIMRTIATQAPVAGDLRLLLTVLKNATDIERFGDYAKDIAELAIDMKDEVYFTKLVNIPRMSKLALEMVHTSLNAFDKGDSSLAREVYLLDDKVDDLYYGTFRILTTYILEDPRNISQAFSLLLVARHLERIADHAVNIANRTIYLVEGDVKYI